MARGAGQWRRLPEAAVSDTQRVMGAKSLFRSINWWRWPADDAWRARMTA
jgi:hypothetical protein